MTHTLTYHERHTRIGILFTSCCAECRKEKAEEIEAAIEAKHRRPAPKPKPPQAERRERLHDWRKDELMAERESVKIKRVRLGDIEDRDERVRERAKRRRARA